MNCTQGDFAIWTGTTGKRKTGENFGKVVRCLSFAGRVDKKSGSDRWNVDVDILSTKRQIHRTARDASLTPLTGTFEEMIAQMVTIRLSGKAP